VHHAVKVSLELEKEGIGVAVYDFLTVKPLDGEAIRDAAKAKYGILVVEDHVMWGDWVWRFPIFSQGKGYMYL